MTFTEMKAAKAAVVAQYEGDSRVKLIAGVRDEYGSWGVFVWPDPAGELEQGFCDMLAALHARHAEARHAGQTLPWVSAADGTAVLYVRPAPVAEVVVPLRPSQPPPKLDATAAALVAMARLAGEARAEAERLHALALEFEDMARRLEP